MNKKTEKITMPVLVVALALTAACSQEKPAESAAATPLEQSQVAAAAPGDPEKGKTVYMSLCVACHGPDAKGLPKLGKSLVTSKFIEEKTDDQLVDFVKVGRLPTDPLNTTGVAMPPKGGNPALKDGQIRDVIAWLRSIHQKE